MMETLSENNTPFNISTATEATPMYSICILKWKGPRENSRTFYIIHIMLRIWTGYAALKTRTN